LGGIGRAEVYQGLLADFRVAESKKRKMKESHIRVGDDGQDTGSEAIALRKLKKNGRPVFGGKGEGDEDEKEDSKEGGNPSASVRADNSEHKL
jgi:hypothetical protein